MMQDKNRVKIAQISDLHLLKSKNSYIHEVNPYERVTRIISFLKNQTYDLLIFSGDIANDGDEESYNQLSEMLVDINVKILLFPGNHDNLQNLQISFKDKMNCIISPIDFAPIKNWKFIHLDTVVQNESYGYISKESANYLGDMLYFNRGKNICVMMHHNPFEIGIPSVDKYKIKNFNIISEILTSDVKLIIHGHVHNNYFSYRDYVIYSSPLSTSFQFAVNGVIDVKNFGFKEYILRDKEIFSRSILFSHEKIN